MIVSSVLRSLVYPYLRRVDQTDPHIRYRPDESGSSGIADSHSSESFLFIVGDALKTLLLLGNLIRQIDCPMTINCRWLVLSYLQLQSSDVYS